VFFQRLLRSGLFVNEGFLSICDVCTTTVLAELADGNPCFEYMDTNKDGFFNRPPSPLHSLAGGRKSPYFLQGLEHFREQLNCKWGVFDYNMEICFS
jgi:hypothetical protein